LALWALRIYLLILLSLILLKFVREFVVRKPPETRPAAEQPDRGVSMIQACERTVLWSARHPGKMFIS
jgi:hypothetical protein